MSLIKPFEQPLDATVLTRIAALRPGQYTRLGAAIRFAAEVIAERAERQRLLFVLTDGKPNDVDHYEGRYGVEDTRRAVLEARRNGLAVFAVTVDDRARGRLPYVFGRGGYALVRQVDRLPPALPAIYRQLTT
jgi:nitric oxide reductase NorD protein